MTRKYVIQLCKENGINVKEENINSNELEAFDEFFITGTTTEIKPVIQIGTSLVNNGEPGTITKRIQNLYYQNIKKKFS